MNLRYVSVVGCAAILSALAGCASPQSVLTKIEYIQQQVPAALLTCENEPKVPEDTNDGEAMANHRIDLALAGDDCRNKLAAVGRVVSPTK